MTTHLLFLLVCLHTEALSIIQRWSLLSCKVLSASSNLVIRLDRFCACQLQKTKAHCKQSSKELAAKATLAVAAQQQHKRLKPQVQVSKDVSAVRRQILCSTQRKGAIVGLVHIGEYNKTASALTGTRVATDTKHHEVTHNDYVGMCKLGLECILAGTRSQCVQQAEPIYCHVCIYSQLQIMHAP